ncbi:MAG: ABC transporter permease, partial [Clostridia bacterium]|nr:ABC transporter permease [Clostridia bacterium]
MRGYIYHVLAWDGMRRNRRLTAPYLITCICMVAVLYILDFLHMQAALGLLQCRGQNTISYILMLGQIVMLLFSLVFLFYTNSFLLRRRLREFGLYSVLGMGRKNLVRIISWESIITFVLALSGGLLAGIALSKMAELGLVNLLGGEVTYAIRLDTQAILRTLLSFSLIFALIWLFSVIRASRLSTVDLMKSESAGEKAPRGNLLLALLGAGLLVYAYDRAITIENPLEAIFGFFLAVIMVIIATYLLMISGSVRLCRVLQRWKNYYYKPQHFVSVSSMAFRMKRNGAGLASICIIATMVLVMLSSTTCLWFGAEDAMLAQYPREINLTVQMNAPSQLSDENLSLFQQAAKDFLETQGGSLHNEQSFRYVYMAGIWEGSELQCDFTRADDTPNFSGLWEIYLVSDTDYTEKTGEPLSLREDEAVLLMDKGIYDADTLTLRMGDISHTFSVKSVSSGTLMP